MSILRILVFGAHPDDAELHAGGLIHRHAQAGNRVRLVSLTDGGAGHHLMDRESLIARRRAEAERAATLLGAEGSVWDARDGELVPTLELRRRVIAEIRRFAPDLVLTHRIHDYHPDHRAAGELVRDACYMVRVPLVVTDVPALPRDPVVASMWDAFTRPSPCEPDVVIGIDESFDPVVRAIDSHASQVYEWIPHTLDIESQVPADPIERLAWLREFVGRRPAAVARRHRAQLKETLGAERSAQVRYAEAYEISEYGRRPTAEELARLFPA